MRLRDSAALVDFPGDLGLSSSIPTPVLALPKGVD
jgi:hypothetical protein